MTSENLKVKVPCTFCPKQFSKSYIKRHMKTHTDELKTREAPNNDKSSEEEIFVNNLEAEEDDDELYNIAEQYSVISDVIGEIVDNATGIQRTQIDPSPSWFMNTMSGLEGLLEEAMEDADNISIETLTGAEIIECDGYTCGECGKNEVRKEEMKKHLNQNHGHQLSMENTPSVIDIRSGEEVLKKKVELYEEAIKNLTNIKEKIVNEKHTMKEEKDKEIRTLENDRDKFYRLHEKAKDSFYRLQGLNVNRIQTVIENKELIKAAENGAHVLQETLKHNQVLDESMKVRDQQIAALEEILAKTKEESEKRLKDAEDEIKEKNSMIRHLEEDLGVWESNEPQLTAANEQLDAREREVESISQEDQEDIVSVAKCQECNFCTKNATKMKGHMVRHRTYKCEQCQDVLKDLADLNSHINRVHRTDTFSCNKCNKQFKAENSLKQHMSTQHTKLQQSVSPPIGHPQWAMERNETNNLDYTCNQCESAFSELKDLRNHKANEHKGESFKGFQNVQKQCHFFKQGRCNRIRCRFAHGPPAQQQQQEQDQQEQQQHDDHPLCTRGDQCQFLAWGKCNYFHPGVGVQQARQQQNGRQLNGWQQNSHQRNLRQQNGQQQNRRQLNGRQQNGMQQNGRQQNGMQLNGRQQNGRQQNNQQKNGTQQVKRLCHFQENCWNKNCGFFHKDFSMTTQFLENY